MLMVDPVFARHLTHGFWSCISSNIHFIFSPSLIPSRCSLMATIPARATGAHRDSYAFETLTQRLPIILTQAIDSVARQATLQQSLAGAEGSDHSHANAAHELREVIGRLSSLKYELTRDKKLRLLTDDEHCDDHQLWTQALLEEDTPADTITEASWFSVSWLYAECYFYRRIREAFQLSSLWRLYDVFAESKQRSHEDSMDQRHALAELLSTTIQEPTEHQKTKFWRLVQCSLWGNKADLSHSAGKSSQQESASDEAFLKLERQILDNDFEQLWELIRQSTTESAIAIVLDNAGYELFSDLCLAEYLLDAQLAGKVVFYVKEYPWFISDVTNDDFQWSLDQYASSANSTLQMLGKTWKRRMEDGSFVMRKDPFWTTAFDFSAMHRVAPLLYHDLSQYRCILFKGDLNYRKLVGDRFWAYDTPFETALSGFHPSNICSLRTLKAECVVGVARELVQAAEEDDPKWLNSGKFAVISVYTQ